MEYWESKTDNGLILDSVQHHFYSSFWMPGFRCRCSDYAIVSIFPFSYETLKLIVRFSWTSLHFVEGWVEPTAGFAGFRCTQPNLRLIGDILKGETQQRQILITNPEVFFDLTGRSFGRRQR
jgi:hypothetical protein